MAKLFPACLRHKPGFTSMQREQRLCWILGLNIPLFEGTLIVVRNDVLTKWGRG